MEGSVGVGSLLDMSEERAGVYVYVQDQLGVLARCSDELGDCLMELQRKAGEFFMGT